MTEDQNYRLASTVLDMAVEEMAASFGESFGDFLGIDKESRGLAASMLLAKAVRIWSSSMDDDAVREVVAHGVTVAITGRPQTLDQPRKGGRG